MQMNNRNINSNNNSNGKNQYNNKFFFPVLGIYVTTVVFLFSIRKTLLVFRCFYGLAKWQHFLATADCWGFCYIRKKDKQAVLVQCFGWKSSIDGSDGVPVFSVVPLFFHVVSAKYCLRLCFWSRPRANTTSKYQEAAEVSKPLHCFFIGGTSKH